VVPVDKSSAGLEREERGRGGKKMGAVFFRKGNIY
jgi:hypothetical protein